MGVVFRLGRRSGDHRRKLMADIAEFIAAMLAALIYGTEDRPRHPFWRAALRAIVFGGGAIFFVSVGLTGRIPPLSLWVGFVWVFASMMLLIGEYECGWPALSLLNAAMMILALIVALRIARP